MVANFSDRADVERFLRDANADELNAERTHLQNLMADLTPTAAQRIGSNLMARIAYELRFRVQQTS